jgi:hypothetical protein
MSYPEIIIELFICHLLGSTSSWDVLTVWSLILSGPLVQEKIKVSSLAAEHVIKPANFGSRSGYRWTGNHRSDTSIQTKLVDLISDRIVASSSYSASFFTNVTGLVMYSI